MAAIDQVITRDLVARELIKRKNWAQREVGVVVVFAIVGTGTLRMPASPGHSFSSEIVEAREDP